LLVGIVIEGGFMPQEQHIFSTYIYHASMTIYIDKNLSI
jgi:hypothetical protein